MIFNTTLRCYHISGNAKHNYRFSFVLFFRVIIIFLFYFFFITYHLFLIAHMILLKFDKIRKPISMNIYGWIGIDANASTNLPFVLVVSCDSYKASLCPFDVKLQITIDKKDRIDYSKGKI